MGTNSQIALEIDGKTGQAVERPLTPEEILEIKEMEKAQTLIQAEQDAKQAARQSALAKLAALGLTEAEIAAL